MLLLLLLSQALSSSFEGGPAPAHARIGPRTIEAKKARISSSPFSTTVVSWCMSASDSENGQRGGRED